MKKSIEIILQKEYKEAMQDIEKLIDDAILHADKNREKYSNKNKIVLNAKILSYIIDKSDEQNPITLKGAQADGQQYYSNIIASNMQQRLSGLIGYDRQMKQNGNVGCYFRTGIAETFEKEYEELEKGDFKKLLLLYITKKYNNEQEIPA